MQIAGMVETKCIRNLVTINEYQASFIMGPHFFFFCHHDLVDIIQRGAMGALQEGPLIFFAFGKMEEGQRFIKGPRVEWIFLFHKK